MRRVLIGLVVAAVGAAGLWYGVGHAPTRAANEPSWRTVAVERGNIMAVVNATGTVNPTATAIVGTQVSGQVVEILADYNSRVKAGDILARLNTEQVRARFDAARADLAQSQALNQIQQAQIEKVRADIARVRSTLLDAQANRRKADALVDDANRTLARQEELRSRGIASEVVLQQARTQAVTQAATRDQAMAQIASVEAQLQSLAADLKVAETQVLSSAAQIAQREAQVRQIDVDLRNSEIRSPVDGIVIQRSIELGQTVAASLQAPTLFLVAQDLTRVEIYANVDEADVGRVQDGQDVSFSVTAFPGREFAGRVKTVRLGSQNIQNVVIYTAIIEVPNIDMALKPGMTATLRIFTERRDNVLRVANTALRWRPPGEQPTAAQAQQAPANPFQPAGSNTPPMWGGGQNFQRQMLDRLASELRLDDRQKQLLEDIAREARQQAQAGGPADTAEARRERGRQVAQAIADRLKPVLRPEQAERLAVWQAERAATRGGGGTPGRIYVIGGDGQPQIVQLRLGATDGNHTEILSGGTEGQQAIIAGARNSRGPANRPGAF